MRHNRAVVASVRETWGSEDFFHQLLRKAVAAEASDIHLKVGQPPGVRVGGDMVYFKTDRLRAGDTEAAVKLLLGPKAVRAGMLEELTEHDTSYSVNGLGRFRVNIYRQRGTFAVVMRSIPVVVPDIESLGLPDPIHNLSERERGMVLVVGATGNGKSTTLAAMVNHINKTRSRHIVTIEDPIEFIHRDERSSVSQREVGLDTPNFAKALRAALRQDPDVILVGEVRDLETAQIAIQASLTGHLVLTTLHTNDAPSSIIRLVDLGIEPFLLTATIEGIVAQRLVRKLDPATKEMYTPAEEELYELGLRRGDVADRQFWRPGPGASGVGGGYKGRMALFEIMSMDDDLRELVMKEASTSVLREHSRRRGMRSLRESGLLAIYEGQTSIDEVVRETLGEE